MGIEFWCQRHRPQLLACCRRCVAHSSLVRLSRRLSGCCRMAVPSTMVVTEWAPCACGSRRCSRWAACRMRRRVCPGCPGCAGPPAAARARLAAVRPQRVERIVPACCDARPAPPLGCRAPLRSSDWQRCSTPPVCTPPSVTWSWRRSRSRRVRPPGRPATLAPCCAAGTSQPEHADYPAGWLSPPLPSSNLPACLHSTAPTLTPPTLRPRPQQFSAASTSRRRWRSRTSGT